MENHTGSFSGPERATFVNGGTEKRENMKNILFFLPGPRTHCWGAGASWQGWVCAGGWRGVGGCGGRGFGSGGLVGWMAGPREVNGIALHQRMHLENRGL